MSHFYKFSFLLSCIFACAWESYAIVPGDFSVNLISGPVFHSDQNECYKNIGPRAVYVGVEICNNSAVTQDNISMTLDAFSSTGFALAGGQTATMSVANPLAPGACDTIYWFCTYPCSNSLTQIVFDIQDTDDGTRFADTTPIINSKRELSANAGGFVQSSTLTLYDPVNRVTCFEVVYGLSKLVRGDEVYLQPVANLDYRADCFQLERATIISSEDPKNGCIPFGNSSLYYEINATCGKSPTWEIVVEYCFTINCPNVSTSVIPYASATSGNDLKYTIAEEPVLILPVELTYFEAQETDSGRVEIRWETVSESNSAYFEVQQSSDGMNFEPLTQIAAAGNSHHPIIYSTLDYEPEVINYYRLKIVDQDGTYAYSEIRMAKLSSSSAAKISFFPNPVKNRLYYNTNFSISENLPEGMSIHISNMQGEKVFHGTLTGNERFILVDSLPAGLYYVNYVLGERNEYFRFMKI